MGDQKKEGFSLEKGKNLNEGYEKKGGIKQHPSTERPSTPPPPSKPAAPKK